MGAELIVFEDVTIFGEGLMEALGAIVRNGVRIVAGTNDALPPDAAELASRLGCPLAIAAWDLLDAQEAPLRRISLNLLGDQIFPLAMEAETGRIGEPLGEDFRPLPPAPV